MGRLFFASLFTLGLLSSFVFGIVILILLYSNAIDIWLAIGLTIGINFLFWLIGPSLSDLINKWFHKVKFVSREELLQPHREVAQIIEQVSTHYKFKFPKVGIIPDKNPTAFTYGSARFNSRIILTEGIFHFLNPQEVRAVVAHELGHIVNRDFIVMMVASTLVQILYEIYATLIRARGKRSGGAKLIALTAYVLYIIGIYLLYYLSRTREYLADEFSTKFTEPNDLSNALIKIAYGIVVAEDDDRSKRLLQSTRHLGILDVKNAKHYGITSYMTHNDPNVLAEVMVFDKVNPWAKLAELNSTHPLTGNRIDHLSDISKASGRPFAFDIDGAIERMRIDKSKLYGGFSFGILVFFLPYIFALFALFYLPIALLPAAFALGLILQLPYKFPGGSPAETTVLEQMRNPYASPLRGKPVALSGQVIGRGIPGYIFGEDMMYQDSTGLVFLSYSSAFGFIGNIFFALKKIKTLFGIPSRAAGWFYRGIGSMISLKYLQTDQEKVRSHPILWALLIPLILVGISLYRYYIFGDTSSLRRSAPVSEQPIPTQQVPATNQPPSGTTASNNETANWAVYSNTKYNYAFRYPQSFTIYTATDQIKEEVILPTATSDKVFLTDRKAKLFCCEPFVTSVSVVNGSLDTQNWHQYADIPDYHIKSQGEIVFAGHKAFEVRGSLGLDSAGARLVLIPGSPFSFVLIQGGEGEPWESITNSFRFNATVNTKSQTPTVDDVKSAIPQTHKNLEFSTPP